MPESLLEESMLFTLLLALFGSVATAGRCPTPEQRTRLTAFVQRVSEAETTEEAQRKALRKLRRSRRAVTRARKLAPGDAELAEVEQELTTMSAHVDAAPTPRAVGEALAPLAQPTAIGCSFSTGEVIAIVLGFVLGIIPGVILLILLC